MKLTLELLSAGAMLIASSAFAATETKLMNKMRGTAPDGVVEGATLMTMDADHQMKTVRSGNNGWTCMEDPQGNPMCADAAAMEFVKAMMTKQTPPAKIGFAYMLKGDKGASNTDPFATKQTADNNWVVTGPHVMILGSAARDMYASYPRTAKADPTKPYVMWSGTPYEHLMLPTQTAGAVPTH